ncbi:MAG: hypothetical protein ACTSPD_11420 [Promethearchaeota archaeon]
MEGTRSEDTLIFFGLTPGITNSAPIFQAIENFCYKKQEIDPSDRFNVIFFEERGPNYLDEFTLNIDNIMIALKSMEPMFVKANVGSGILTAITFCIDVFKRISEKCFRLIIILDSGSLRIRKTRLTVIYDLINKVNYMPFYMDIIRINDNNAEEGEKLKKLAEFTDGMFFDIKDYRELPQILDKLIEKKDYYLSSKLDESQTGIPEEKQDFFENLADIPLKVKAEGKCSICFKNDIVGLVQCPICDTYAHKKCWALWAKKSHIGMKNLFRCHNCFNLLKLDKDYVDAVQTGKVPIEEEIKIETKSLLKHLQFLESESQPKLVKSQESLGFSTQMEGDLEVEISEDEIESDFFEQKKQLRRRRPKRGESRVQTKFNFDFIFCPNCNRINPRTAKKCIYCTYPL